ALAAAAKAEHAAVAAAVDRAESAYFPDLGAKPETAEPEAAALDDGPRVTSGVNALLEGGGGARAISAAPAGAGGTGVVAAAGGTSDIHMADPFAPVGSAVGGRSETEAARDQELRGTEVRAAIGDGVKTERPDALSVVKLDG